MTTIYKYGLAIAQIQEIEMPKGAEILSVQFQDGLLKMWALIDEKQSNESRVFEVFGTGHKIPIFNNRKFIATAQERDYVWHIFELLP